MLTIYQRLILGYVLLLALLVGAGLNSTKSLHRAAALDRQTSYSPVQAAEIRDRLAQQARPGCSPEPFSAFWSQPVFSSPSSVPYTGWR